MNWTLLGLAPDADEHTIKHAYAQRLREIGGPEGDPKAFQELREAYEACLADSKETRKRKQTEAEKTRQFFESLFGFGFGGLGGFGFGSSFDKYRPFSHCTRCGSPVVMTHDEWICSRPECS